jgi:hypothetical protein
MNRTDPCGSFVLPTLTPGLAHGAGSSRNTGPGTRVPHQPTSRAEAESTPNQLPMSSPSAGSRYALDVAIVAPALSVASERCYNADSLRPADATWRDCAQRETELLQAMSA